MNLNAPASPSTLQQAPCEKERTRIHEILFPSIKRSRIPDATSKLLSNPVRVIGLSEAEADELVGSLARVVMRFDQAVIMEDLGLDKAGQGITSRDHTLEPQEEEGSVDPASDTADPAVVKPDFAFKTKASKSKRNERTLGHRQYHAYKKELLHRHEQINEQFGPYVPHIAASLGKYIQRMPNEQLLKNSSEWESVTRWCYSYSFLANKSQRGLSRAARGLRPATTKQEPAESAPEETVSSGSAPDLALEKLNHVRLCQSAYDEYLKRMVTQALRVLTADPSEATSLAEGILQSVEKVFADAGNQLSIVRGEAHEARLPVYSKTRQMQVSALRDRSRLRLSELLALWTELSVNFGGNKPLRSVLPPETVDLGVLQLARDTYPRRSPIWDTARSHLRGLIGEPSTAAPEEQSSGSTVPEEYRVRLVTEALTQSPPVLRSLVRNAAHRGQYETVTNLWHLTKGDLERRRPEDNEESMTTLCTFLEVLLRTLSFGSHVLESQKALAEVFSCFPRPTPLPIYHTLLSVYSGRYNAAMARDLPGPSHRNEGNHMHDNLRATWDKMQAEGIAKDLEAYKIAVMGFGSHGDVEAVKRCWTDLNQDQDCKRIWNEEADSRCHFSLQHWLCKRLIEICLTEGSEDVFPPVEMVNVFISTFLNSTKVSGAAEIAVLMFESICDPKSRHKPDIVTANIMLKHYVARGDIEAMSSVMAKLSSLKLKPDVFTYTTVVEGLLKSGRREVARDTLDLMESTGIAPSPHTYGLLIGDLARAGTREDMARAEALVKRMRQAKLTPSTVTYTALLGGYYRAGMAAQGSAILRQMEKDGVDMNRVTYNMILRSILTSKEDAPSSSRTLKQAGDRTGTTEAWRSIINAMLSRGIVPNDDTWYILLSGLHRARRFEEADNAIDEMRRQEFRPGAGTALSKLIIQIQQRKLARPVIRSGRSR